MAPPRKSNRLPRRDTETVRRPWRRRCLIAAPVFLALYALGGFFAVPWALQRWAVPAVNDQLNGTLAVRTFRCNPFALSLTLEGVEITDRAGTRVLGFERFYGNLQASSLIRRGVVLHAIALDQPFVQAELLEDGQINLAQLAKPADPSAPEPEAPDVSTPPQDGPPPWPRVRVGRVAVTDAQLVFVDHMIAANTFRFEIHPLTFEIPKLDTLADHENPHLLRAQADGGAEFGWQGKVFMNPLTSEGQFTLKGVDLARFQPYVGRFSALHLAQGTLKLDLAYALAPAAEQPRMSLDLRSFAVDGLRIEQDDTPVVDGLNVALAGLSIDAVNRTARLEQLAVRDATLRVVREADGGLQLARAVHGQPFGPAPASSHTPATAQPVTPPAPTPDPTSDPTPAPAQAPWTPVIQGLDRIVDRLPEAWDVEVTSLAVERHALQLTDASTPTAADIRLRDITFTAGPIRSTEGYDVPFAFDFTQATADGSSFAPGPGTLEVTGRLGLEALTADIDTTIAGLDLTPASPYVAQAMPSASLPSGRIGLRGKATVDAGDGLQAATFTGEFDLDALRVDGPLDQAPLLAYDTLAVRGIAFDHAAGTLNIATLEGDGLSGAVAIDLSATDNADADADSPDTDQAPQADATADADGYQPLAVDLPYRVTIGRLHQTRIDGLALINGIEPPLHFTSTDGEFTVNDLDLGSESPTPANLSFATALQDTGRFTLNGNIAPNLQDLNNSQAQLDYQLTKLPLAGFSGFTARYLGRELTSGELTLGNAVALGDAKFDTVIPLTIENFAFGAKVDSPDAVKLPLDLAVAILKDSKGNIKPPDVPVAGPLNDPSVSVGELVWFAVGSLIKSVVAAPFNLLGDALGGGDDTQGDGGAPAITFAPGEAQLPAEAAATIQTLAQALNDRPALGLRLVAQAAPAKVDENALRHATLRRRLQEIDGGTWPDDTRYAQAIAQWYAQNHTSDAPLDQKVVWALAEVDVDPQALQALSAQRVDAVHTALVAAGLDATRLMADAQAAPEDASDDATGAQIRLEAAVP